MAERFFSRKNVSGLLSYYMDEWKSRDRLYHGNYLYNSLSALITIALAPVNVFDLLIRDISNDRDKSRKLEGRLS